MKKAILDAPFEKARKLGAKESFEKSGSSEGVRRSWETRRQKKQYRKTADDVREVGNASLTWGEDVRNYYQGLRDSGKSHEDAIKQVNQAGEYRARTRIGKEPLRPLKEFEGKVWKWPEIKKARTKGAKDIKKRSRGFLGVEVTHKQTGKIGKIIDIRSTPAYGVQYVVKFEGDKEPTWFMPHQANQYLTKLKSDLNKSRTTGAKDKQKRRARGGLEHFIDTSLQANRKNLPQVLKDATRWQRNKDAGITSRRTVGDVILGVARAMHPEKELDNARKIGIDTPKTKAEKDFDEIREWQLKKGKSIQEWKEYLQIDEPEKAHPSDNISSIGKSKKDGKWYGWSHRAINGFKTREEAIKFAESVS